MIDSPVDGSFEHIAVIPIQTEYEAAVDHDPERMQPAHCLPVVLFQVLFFVTLFQVFRGERFETYKKASQTSIRRLFDQITP